MVESSVSKPFDLQFILHAIPGEYLILDTDLIMLTASDDYLAATKTTREELIGKYVFDVFPDNPEFPGVNVVENLRDSMLQVIQTRETNRISMLRYDIRGENGTFEQRYWDIVDSPIINSANKVVGLIHHSTDVTTQVKAREAARRNEEMIRVVTQAVNDVIWDWNLETNQVNWNEGFNTKFGYAVEETEPTSLSWTNRIHPEDLERVSEKIHHVIDHGEEHWTDMYRFRLKDGSYAVILDRGAVLRDETGKPYRMIGAMVDITLNKKAEKEALENENRLRSIMESIPQMAWAATTNGEVYYYNQQWPKYLGVTLEDLYSNGWTKYMHPEDLVKTLANWERCLKTGENVEFEHRYLQAPHNEYKWFLTRAVATRNNEGEIVNWVGTCTYIDDQKKITQKLQEQEEKVQRILSQAPAHFCLVKGTAQVIDFASPGMKKLFGNRECIGLPIAQAWPEIAEQGLTNNMREVYESGKPQFFWENLVMVDRENTGELTEGFYDFTYQPFWDYNGKIEGVLVLAIEVTEQVLAKQAAFKLSEELLEEKERFQFLADTIPQLVWTTDPQGYHTYFNQRWIDYTGYTVEDSQGTEMWNNLLHPEDRERSRKRWQHSLNTGEFYEIEYRFKSKEGTYRWFLGQAAPMRNVEGEIYKWFGTCTDIEEQKRWQEEMIKANEDLKKANADLDSFVYTASHDLKLPIISMGRIFEELTNSATFADPDAEKLVGMFQKSLSQINATIQDLADIVKVQKNAQQNQEFVSLAAITDEVKLSIQDMIKDSQARITTDFSGAPEVYFSKVNLKSVIYNLMSNAIKYRSPERIPEVQLKSRIENNCLILTVQDNGLGINLARHKEKLYQMFKRFHNHVPGSGIGLYIVNRIVKNQGGTLELETEVDRGSTFKISLPHKEKNEIA
ncbi:PAS domain-containing protein [Adhaeribacter sp. BT258]|uniref:histidine kinase n=1 Tax=Adhaeribacter terrigena TaxID=2793070 RepID=A0ABS1BYA5_9BACT|nr:PAS domain-containing protein [Adhaeribacter terrigena]MBK0402084.1 PAS domain-containing protein [Adhaeribacter terrigena]